MGVGVVGVEVASTVGSGTGDVVAVGEGVGSGTGVTVGVVDGKSGVGPASRGAVGGAVGVALGLGVWGTAALGVEETLGRLTAPSHRTARGSSGVVSTGMSNTWIRPPSTSRAAAAPIVSTIATDPKATPPRNARERRVSAMRCHRRLSLRPLSAAEDDERDRQAGQQGGQDAGLSQPGDGDPRP